jgi:anti-sigma factor RsiW
MIQPHVRCIEFVELITDWMEGALSDDVRAEVEEHMAICPGCTEYLEQLRITVRLAHEEAREAPPPDARAALIAAFRAR